jgi:brefeldin A-inhibited guanine nucleotide-exchange protein
VRFPPLVFFFSHVDMSGDVNEASLLRAVRSCYNIHLVSHSMVNKTTAKATLTQVFSFVFKKMEATDLAMKEKQAAALSTGSSSSEELAKADAAAESSVAVVAAGDGTGGAGGGGSSSGSGGGGHWASVDHKNAWLLFRALCKLSMKDAPSYSGQSSSPDDAGGGGGGSGASGEDGAADAAAAAAAAAAADPIAVQSKALSLELILSVLRTSGPAFKGSDKFVHAIRSYLCVSLLRNCTAAVPDVVDVSLQVFVQLVEHFKDHLKAEIEVFITKIFLRILDSENSTHHHKGLVLEVFHTMCQDPAALVEIFLNYDADFESTNDIFKQMVGVLSRCAKGASSFNAHAETSSFGGASRRSAAQENKLRMMGLKGLGSILKSLVQCSSNAAASASSSSTTTMTLASTPATPQRATKGQGGESSELAEDAPLSPLPAGGQGMDSRSLAIGGSVPTSPSLVSGLDAVEVFDRKQRFKEEQQRGILQFNLAPKKGLAYLEERGHLKHEPREVAKFLHQLRDQLDKTQIGDYLGKEKEYAGGFCVKVLHEYIDMMEFGEMVFDEAIRHFLSGFRLPGEAQKIGQ